MGKPAEGVKWLKYAERDEVIHNYCSISCFISASNSSEELQTVSSPDKEVTLQIYGATSQYFLPLVFIHMYSPYTLPSKASDTILLMVGTYGFWLPPMLVISTKHLFTLAL